MSATVIIPARYGSTRFPAKILAADTGKPLVQHVVEQARKCHLVREVIVATDDARIAEALKPFGTRVVMTSPDHQSGTDRIAEVAQNLDDEIIINVQGDEPEIEPETIHGLIHAIQKSDANMATVAVPLRPPMDVNDPNLVKVVLAGQFAMYFSRSVIPFHRDPSEPPPTYYLHVGMYSYRRAFLLRYPTMPQTPAEKAEKLEQLRALENGERILVTIAKRAAHGIDTREQYRAFVDRYQKKLNHEVTKARSGS